MTATGRSLTTLAVLGALFLGGVAWAWSQVTEPFPEPQDAPACTETAVDAGESVRPGQVLVSVLNASGRNGLAGATMDALVERGFGDGQSGNVSVAGADTMAAQIWAADPAHPAVRLVKSYLGRDVEVVDQPSDYDGIVIVVGERFGKVTKGLKKVEAKDDTTVCAPPLAADETDS